MILMIDNGCVCSSPCLAQWLKKHNSRTIFVAATNNNVQVQLYTPRITLTHTHPYPVHVHYVH